MTTPPVNPWNLDEYARYLHHTIGYLMTKSKSAAEKDDVEAVERYSGKAGYLLDKVVPLIKARALAKQAGTQDVGELEPKPNPLDDHHLSPTLKAQIKADLEKREKQLAEKRAMAMIWEIEDMIHDLDEDREMSVLSGVLNSCP